MGSTASNSAVATIVERMTGYLTLLHLPDGHGADAVAAAVIARMTALPGWFARTLTWDNGREMARHARITDQTGINVYFADPYSPWQRGSNENTNGLLREYLPKGTDLSQHTPAQLQAIEDELNDRPRKRLGYHTPAKNSISSSTEQTNRCDNPLNTPTRTAHANAGSPAGLTKQARGTHVANESATTSARLARRPGPVHVGLDAVQDAVDPEQELFALRRRPATVHALGRGPAVSRRSGTAGGRSSRPPVPVAARHRSRAARARRRRRGRRRVPRGRARHWPSAPRSACRS